MGLNFQICPIFCAAVETRSQAKECEKKYRKLKVPDQIIDEDKEA